MKQDSELKWQAYVDGELPPAERRALERRLETDAEARRLVSELTAVKEAFGRFESTVKVPVPREFYWSGIQRQIQVRLTWQTTSVPAADDWFARLRRFLLPAGAVALLITLGMLGYNYSQPGANPGVGGLKASLASAGTFTYRDFASGTTLVWVSYPAENEFADFDTAFTLPE
jgi:anti-sigma-K factor RskA